MDTAVVAVSSRTAASSCSPLSPDPVRARRAMPSLTRGGTCPPGLPQDPLLQVDLPRGGVPGLVRRPVDARPVPPRPQRRHVGDLRRGHQQHPGPRARASPPGPPPGGPAPARRPEAAPGRPRTAAPTATTPRDAPAPPPPRPAPPSPSSSSSITTAGRDPNAATSRCTRDSAVISAAAVCASHAASRSASSASSAAVPWILRAADFGRRVIAAACWSISHSVRLDGGCPYLRSIRRGHLLDLGPQRRRPRREQVHDLLGHPADLAAVPVRRAGTIA